MAENCSIIGLTLGKGVAEAREAAGKIEGIGDVLREGTRKVMEVDLIGTRLVNGTKTEKMSEERDPGSERTLVACLIHAGRARQQCLAANG